MKRSIVLTSLLMFLSATTLLASTNVPSLLSGDAHWDKSGSPYLIQGKVTIPSGSHLTIGSAVQVIFQGAAVLEVNGKLEAGGSAAGPVVFNLLEGGLQSEIFINGGEARFTNVKILSGVFLAKDAKLSMDGADVTKGSGIYLQGSTVAHLKNNKVYGNSTGVVLDGPVVANLQFNTLVQNSYGLYIKSLSGLTFQNNSIHDNQMEVVSQVPLAKLGGNYWGVNNSKDLMPKIQGKVALKPMRTLKDVLRIYVRNELPIITQQMASALNAREKKADKEQADALKKYKEQMRSAAKAQAAAPSAAPAPPVPGTSEAAVPQPPEGAPPVPSTSAPSASTGTAPETTAASSSVPPVPEVPDMGGAAPPSVPSGTEASTIPVPPSTSTTTGEGIPAPPDLAEQVPPSVPESTTTSSTTASSNVPPVPSVPSGEMPVAPAPPAVTASTSSPTVPAPPAAAASTESPAAPAPPSVPEAPAVASVIDSAPPQESENSVPTPIPPAQATESQMKVVNELKAVNGDIDGMQAPPLETNSEVNGTGSKSKNKASNVSNLDLPPLRDSDILPPRDLDLPPTEDMGNINMNSPSK